MGTYDHLSPKRRSAMQYGARLRYIRCLLANANAGERGGFKILTMEELAQIRTIHDNALIRAERTYREETQRHAEADLRTEAESRQYSGK